MHDWFFAERVGKLSGGRLTLEMLASGSVVPPFESLDATGRGVIDGAHAAPAYWVGKNTAAALFGPAPGGPFGMDMLHYLGWKRGLIECAEGVGPAEDMKLGFHQVFKHYYMPSLHEPAVMVELLINGKVWEKLPPEFQEIIKAATLEATITSAVTLNKANAADLKGLREKHTVQIGRTPNDILIGMLEVWDKLAAQEADRNPFFKKVYESQRRWAADVVTSRLTVHPAYEAAADYYWPQK